MKGNFSKGKPIYIAPEGTMVWDENAGLHWIQIDDPRGPNWINDFDSRTQYAVPIAASTVVVSPLNAVSTLILDPAGTLSSLTITLPLDGFTPRSGQILRVHSRQIITTLTINGGTVHGGPASMVANGFFVLVYSTDTFAWHRIG